MRHRNRCETRFGERRRDAGHDLEGNPGLRERQCFFAAASKNKWVAALEPHHPSSAASRADKRAVDGLLPDGLGASSTTDDLEGELTPATAPAPTRDAVEAALPAFTGAIEQRPPAFSAIKVAGRRAYAMARAGEAVELAPRAITIHGLDLADWDEATAGEPFAIVDVECSAGTYIRSLARDLGAAVGSAAYLGALTRTASGPFELAAAIDLEAVRAAAADGPAAVAALLLPIDAGLDLATVAVPDGALVALGRGQPIGVPPGTGALDPEQPIRLVDERGRLLAIARLAGTKLAPDKVLVDPPRDAEPGAAPGD